MLHRLFKMERNQQCNCWDWCYSTCLLITKLNYWGKCWQMGFSVVIPQGSINSKHSYLEARAILDGSVFDSSQRKARNIIEIFRKRGRQDISPHSLSAPTTLVLWPALHRLRRTLPSCPDGNGDTKKAGSPQFRKKAYVVDITRYNKKPMSY